MSPSTCTSPRTTMPTPREDFDALKELVKDGLIFMDVPCSSAATPRASSP